MSEILIIGSGISALTCALNIDEKHNVTIITKDNISKSSSMLAQGGIAATLDNKNNCAINSHKNDTFFAGSNLNDINIVEELVDKSHLAIEFLEDNGVLFDRNNNEYLLTKEGGHSVARILRAGKDITGKIITESLFKKVLLRKNIKIIENLMLIELIKDEKKCKGGLFLDKNNNILEFYANDIVLATGGIGSAYKYSTNPKVITGDGIASAYRTGAEIIDMEFIQFHPTAFYFSKDNQKFLISETLRGEGGKLRNIEGDLFMHKYHDMADLAPRDIVSQSIYKEMYDTWSDYIYLDMTHLDTNFLINRFPNIYSNCLKFNIDITKDLIPITPVQHYLVGGIKTNINAETNIKNLYAVGECACNRVHGANRLASNSLLECVVFSLNASKFINNKNGYKIKNETQLDKYKNNNNLYNYNKIKEEVLELLTRNLGVIREKQRIEYSYNIFKEKVEVLEKHKNMTRIYYETLNITTVAYLISKASKERKSSLGCHYILGE